MGFSGEKLGISGEELEISGEKLEGLRMESINEENVERMVEVIGGERLLEVIDVEMEIFFERVEGSDEELEGIEKGVVGEEDVLSGANVIIDEFVFMEEKEVIDEEFSDGGR